MATAVRKPVTQRRRHGAGTLRMFVRILPSILFLFACLVAWTLAVHIFDIKPYVLPTPMQILDRTVHDWDLLWMHSLVTLRETVLGFVLGSLIGFVLAILIAASRMLREMIYPLLIASQAVPKLAIAPLLVIWFGFGIWPKVVVTILLVFFPVAITSAEGLMTTDKNLLTLLRSVNASPLQVFLKVKVPQALPHVMSGLRIGITLAVVGAVVGEWVGASEGLGYLIISANSRLDSVLSFSAVFVLVVMGVVLFLVLEALGRLIAPWERQQHVS
jgi:NitT/TauT family transport system permease protein